MEGWGSCAVKIQCVSKSVQFSIQVGILRMLIIMLGEAHWLKLPTLARPHSNHLHELFHDGRSTNRKSSGRSKGDTTCLTTSQNPSLWHPSWLNKACTTRKDSESEWLAKDNPETNPITIKPETASHVTELFFWVPLPYCSPPRCPFPIKSLALSARVSPQTIHFWVVDKSPVSGPGRGPPSCNNYAAIRGVNLDCPGQTRWVAPWPRSHLVWCHPQPLSGSSVLGCCGGQYHTVHWNLQEGPGMVDGCRCSCEVTPMTPP